METTPTRGARFSFLVGVTIATALAVWLRTYGIAGQVVLDDEWHAIHKLASSSYGGILGSFGFADHSIPLTVLYKAMAQVVGLDEWNMRALQVACGIALVPIAAWLAWRATRDAPAAALFAFLVSGAPFLVMWSRFARPYAITLLLTVLCLAALWCWRTRRSWQLGACVAVTAALSAWLHPISGLYAAIGCLFIFFEDLSAAPDIHPRPSRSSLRLGIAVAGAMAFLLAAPLIKDGRSLTGKAGGDQPGLGTYESMLSIYWGGLPAWAFILACVLTAWGAIAMLRRDPRLGAFLMLLGVVPAAILTLLGAQWAHQGQNFGRYILPLQLILLFFGSVGAMSVARALVRRWPEAAAWTTAATLSVAYLYATPAIAQVATLGPWYAHLDYHWDYRYRWNVTRQHDRSFDPPEFYRKLGRMAPGSAPIIEAPFSFAAPANLLDYYASFHRQPETLGMIHDLCLKGGRVGEPPPCDPRFRFRKFVFLDEVSSVKQSGARYLLLLRERLHGRAFHENERCIEKLTSLYGAPVQIDARLAVFDLRPGEPEPKLQ
jgi:Dolichyl-phosphate-mannose-protein mannosyltransferase